MRNSSKYGARLTRLYNQLQRSQGRPEELTPQDVTTEMILACLSATTTQSRARAALSRLRSAFVDYNELRVCRPEEVAEVLGKSYPQAQAAAEQIVALLRSVFQKKDNLDLDHLTESSKREAKIVLENLSGATPYVVACVMLWSLRAHAFPVNEQMLAMLRAEEVVAPKSDAADVQGFLERHISASKIRAVYALLRRHADNFKSPHTATASTEQKTRKAKSSVAAARKSSRQTTPKKNA